MRSFAPTQRGGLIGLAATGIIFVALLSGSFLLRPDIVDASSVDHCKTGGGTQTTVIAIDASNALASKNMSTMRRVIYDATKGDRGDRLIIVRFSGSRYYQPEILMNACDPGEAHEADPLHEGPRAREMLRRKDFLKPIEIALEKLAQPTAENAESNIGETIMRLVADPAMHLDKSRSALVVITDLLENSARSSPYTNGHIELPEIHEPFLTGIKTTIVELPAPEGASALQSHEIRMEFRRWIKKGGASETRFVAPGLAT